MTHPCDQRNNAAGPERIVISLSYTPEIYARKRAQRLAREAWRQAQELSQRLMAGPALHKHPAMIALAHVLARAAARAAMSGTGEAKGHVPPAPPAAPAATGPTPDTGSVTTGADLSTPRRTFDRARVIAPPVRNCGDHGDANGHGTDDADDFGDVSF